MQGKKPRRLTLNAKLVMLVVGLLIFSASRADACSCGPVLPCEAYARAQVVFVGLVTKTGRVSSKGLMPSTAMSTTLTDGATSAHFKIEETLLGTKDVEIDVFGEGTTCDYYFEQGKRYLVYAYRSSDGTTLHTNICAGTAPVHESRKHLSYLHEVKNRPSGSVFLGRVNREFHGPAQGTVIIESGGRILRARINARGHFAFKNLSAGKYLVHTLPRANSSSLDVMAEDPRTQWEIEIPDHGCIKEWFQVRPEGEISGQLIGGMEKTNDLWVDILFAGRPKQARTNFNQAPVNADGRFKFSFLPPGRYFIGFNLTSGPYLDYPYAESYYPGVPNRTRAKIISIGNNQRISGINLPFPTRVPERTIEGVAVWPDNQLAAHVLIDLVNPRTGYTERNTVQTDEVGRFSMPGMEGQTYGLSALVNKGIPLVHSRPLMIKVRRLMARCDL
jgi:hypothetical protein